MKKLLLVGSNTIHTYNYLELIESHFDEILLITDKKRENSKYHTLELDFGLNLQAFFKTTNAIRKSIAEFKPTIIHIHQANSYALYTNIAAMGSKIPKVLTGWGSDILVMPKRSFLLKRIVVFNLKHANWITSDSNFMADEMKRLCPTIGPVLIANFGISIDPLPEDKELIIYSNRLHKKLYRVDKILIAFRKFLDRVPSDQKWKLIIAAVGEETDDLKKLSLDLNLNARVEFVGWIDKKINAEWYSKAMFWVSIPESDATAISLLEAMACGCIPIVSDLPANREWINNGVNGVIVSDVDDDFLTHAVSLKMENAQAINKERIEKDGTKSANRMKFLELYQTIIK